MKLRVTARQRTAHLRHAADIIPAGRGACPRSILSPVSGGTALQIFMTGEADVPTGDPVGTGEATVRLRRGQGQVCYRLEVSNITLPSVGAHIHHGGAGESGPIVVPLRQPGANGQSSGCTTVSRALVSQMLANRDQYYVNVHTTDFPGGAVRGQLTGTSEADLGRTVTVTLNGASECNAAGVVQPRRRRRRRHDGVPVPRGQRLLPRARAEHPPPLGGDAHPSRVAHRRPDRSSCR